MPRNPARATYAYWKSILDGYRANACNESVRAVAYGPSGWGLALADSTTFPPETIAFGSNMSYWGVWGQFFLTPQGHFSLAHMHGEHRRSCIVRGVPWLAWAHDYSRYQWYVRDPEEEPQKYHRRSLVTRNYDEARPYVSEDLLGIRLYWQTKSLCKLERRDDRWVIVPVEKDQRDHFDRYQRLVDKRYARLRHQAEGDDDKKVVSERVPSVRSDGKILEGGEAVECLAAMLDIHKPAKIKPLRPKEAHHHGNDMAPASD